MIYTLSSKWRTIKGGGVLLILDGDSKMDENDLELLCLNDAYFMSRSFAGVPKTQNKKLFTSTTSTILNILTSLARI